MFSGIQELLIIVVIIGAIIVIPRLKNPRKLQQPTVIRQLNRPSLFISGPLRLAIIASIVWPAVIAYYFKPWQNDISSFLYFGLGPIALGWGLFWIWKGFKNNRFSR